MILWASRILKTSLKYSRCQTKRWCVLLSYLAKVKHECRGKAGRGKSGSKVGTAQFLGKKRVWNTAAI